jgi:anti-anti-sigma factor
MTRPANEMPMNLRYVDGATVVHPTGRLDVRTYASLRDTLLKCASDHPDALLVEVDDLDLPTVQGLAVFSLVATRIADWPGVQLMIVAAQENRRRSLTAGLIGRFVPVYDTVTAAIAAISQPPMRSRAVMELTPSVISARRARHFVRANCQRWQVPDLANDAMLIATVLVENTMQHTNSAAVLRLELRRGILTVAVSDDDPRPPVLRERLEGGVSTAGLLTVASIAKAWGCAPTMNGGKTIWATLRLPGHKLWISRDPSDGE